MRDKRQYGRVEIARNAWTCCVFLLFVVPWHRKVSYDEQADAEDSRPQTRPKFAPCFGARAIRKPISFKTARLGALSGPKLGNLSSCGTFS